MQRKIQALFYTVIGETKRILFGIKYYAFIEITDNCNLRCKHCYHFKNLSKTIKPIELPISVWKKRFEDLYKKGIRFMTLCGGEPTLRLDIIELAYGIFPIVYLFTNGQIKITKELNRLIIFLSLDGDQSKNDAIRGEGTFKKLFENYSGDRRVVISMALCKYNYMDLETVIELAKQHSLRGVICNFYTNNPAYPDPLFLHKTERSLIIKELHRIKKLYPWNLLLTKSMIDWYVKPDHSSDYCFYRYEVLHFDNSWNKRKCFYGRGYCVNCGCFSFSGGMRNPWRYVRELFMLI